MFKVVKKSIKGYNRIKNERMKSRSQIVSCHLTFTKNCQVDKDYSVLDKIQSTHKVMIIYKIHTKTKDLTMCYEEIFFL